jgi:hypothetical protein
MPSSSNLTTQPELGGMKGRDYLMGKIKPVPATIELRKITFILLLTTLHVPL